MLLAFDVGNTNLTLGVFRREKLEACWRLSTRTSITADELAMSLCVLFGHHGLEMREVTGAIVSSVVPPLTPVVLEVGRRYLRLEPLVVGPGIKMGMPIRFENPREVGADRIVNAVAGYELYGGPVIVVDFGTATTFDAISAQGEYLGGAIAPGIGISTEALFLRAAKLPRVELVKPKSVIGRNTVASMQAGIIYGFIGQVEHIVKLMRQELGSRTKVVATGGLAEMIAGETKSIDQVNPHLTLEGLRILYQRNTAQS
ncbi:MAG: type III pantothenate kinase [Clostridia bacterium]|nr:type III pantothenate kinase [Clostridia bacterium]MDH7573341.1 type III pantothenate kinase [Clostridia bacterium]